MKWTMLRYRLVCAVAISLMLPPLANAAKPSGWAVIFAPAVYPDLGVQPHQSYAAQQILTQLENSGWPSTQLRLLSGHSATIEGLRTTVEHVADSMAKDEVMLVVLLARAVLDQNQMICTAADSQLSLSQLLKQMATAPTSKRLLVADFTLDKVGSADHPIDYAARGVPLGANQFLVINAAEAIDPAPTNEARMSPFAKAFVDTLGGFAAEKNQNEVSLFAALEYLRLYMQARGLRPPVVQGSTNGNYALVAVDQGVKNAPTPEQAAVRQRMAESLIHSAEREFLVARNIPLSRSLLDRARHYADNEVISARIDQLSDCLVAFEGGEENIRAALRRSQERKQPLILRLDRNADQIIDVNGKRETRRLSAGTWLLIEKEKNGWLWVVKTLKGELAAGQIRFETASDDGGWIGLNAFPPRTPNPNIDFGERLRWLSEVK